MQFSLLWRNLIPEGTYDFSNAYIRNAGGLPDTSKTLFYGFVYDIKAYKKSAIAYNI